MPTGVEEAHFREKTGSYEHRTGPNSDLGLFCV